MQNKAMAAEYERLLLQEYGQQRSSECTLGAPCSQPNQQQHSTFQPGSWPGEQQHLQYLEPRPALQPGEQQQSADSTFELDPFSEMQQMEDFNFGVTYDLNTGEVLLQMETEVSDASGQQHFVDSSLGSTAPHGEPQHSAPSPSQPGSSSGEQRHAERLTPGPSSKSGECPHSASKTDELPSSSEPGTSSQSGRQQQHLDAAAAAGGSSPTEQQNSLSSWYSSFRPTGRPGEWQLDGCFGWLPVSFPKDLLPAWMLRQMQQQRSSSQTRDRRHPVASDRRHPVASSSQPSDRRHPPLSSKPGDQRRHPVASSSQPDDQRRHPVGSSSPPGLQQHSVHSELGPSSQSGRQQPLPHSSSAGEQQHLDAAAAAGGSSPTEQQNSVSSWYSSFRPTGRPGKWQLDGCFGWQPVPFPKDLLPACMLRQMQQQSWSSQTPDRRHPVASDRQHPEASSSQPSDRRHAPLSSKPGDQRRHPVASSLPTDDQRRHPVASSSPPGDHQLPPSSSRPSAGDRPPPCVRPVHWDHLTLDYKPRRRSDSKPGYQQNTVGSNEQHPESSSQPDDRQHPAIAARPDQQQQDEAHPTSISVPNSEAGDRQDAVRHPHVPGSQLDQLEGGHKDRA
ncbi:hypothetical protein COCNU_scaffold012088G000010 [Cocos nucifera]|nr:hypothetical protein [Cocos nucifera]